MQRLRIRLALLLVLIAALTLAATIAIFAAGESLQRSAILSGGGGSNAGGATLRSAAGEPVAGLVFASSGASLCSGFVCAPALAAPACTPLTSVTINGPTVGITGTALNYSALVEPAEASAPIVYTWSPVPTGGQGTPLASITFVTTGAQVVAVTASNCSSAAANDDLAVTINSSTSGKAVTSVAIAGPATGSTDTDYTFTATVSPSDADTPITYTWAPAPKSGQGTASAVYTFPSTGAKNISVTAQNAAGGNSDLHTIIISASGGGKLYVPVIQHSP